MASSSTTTSATLTSPWRYLLLRTTPPTDPLALRLTLQTSLSETFGLTAAGTQIDVLWIAPGEENEKGNSGTSGRAIVRVSNSGADATRVLASIAASSSAPRVELLKSTVFLPSLLVC